MRLYNSIRIILVIVPILPRRFGVPLYKFWQRNYNENGFAENVPGNVPDGDPSGAWAAGNAAMRATIRAN